jgi:hypothetical protein
MDAKLVSKTTIAAAASVGGGDGRENSARETRLDEVSVENLSDLSSYLEKLKEFREVVLGRIREAIDNEDDTEEEEEEEVEEEVEE